ncbi:GD24296 [Drosophila simulans]|uniref:GD24296 n=1 Tax=Drosophila simulans TaxID=7240 RepID=B4Q3X3_DROSI|nr:GD24296 [Drosophila simulans]
MPITEPQPSAECMDRPELKGNAEAGEAGLEKEKEGSAIVLVKMLVWEESPDDDGEEDDDDDNDDRNRRSLPGGRWV